MENVFKIDIIHYIDTSGDVLEYATLGCEKVTMQTIDELVKDGFSVRLRDVGRAMTKHYPDLKTWNSHKPKEF